MFLIDRREKKQDNTAQNIGDPFSIYPYKTYMATSRMDQFPKSQFSVRWAWVVSQIDNFQRGFLSKSLLEAVDTAEGLQSFWQTETN